MPVPLLRFTTTSNTTTPSPILARIMWISTRPGGTGTLSPLSSALPASRLLLHHRPEIVCALRPIQSFLLVLIPLMIHLPRLPHLPHRLLRLLLALARVIFTCTFQTTKTCQQEALGIHRHLPLEQELQRQRHLLGGFNYMFRTHSWSKRQGEDRLRQRPRRLPQLPFEHSIPSLSIETSR